MKFKRIISLLLAVMMMVATLVPLSAVDVEAATASTYSPHAQVEYSYTADVQCGTIRYINQIVGGTYYSYNYWEEWEGKRISGVYYGPGKECGTACISMALSYVGVNKTPKDILDYGKGVTYFQDWGNAVYKPLSSTAITTAMDNYINGHGKYSPPVIHIPGYSADGHFVVVIGKIDSNTYEILDPNNRAVNTMTIEGSSAKYSKYGSTITDKIDSLSQWYNPKADLYPSYCTSYPCAITVKITEDCSPYTLPCNNSTAQKYGCESIKLDEYGLSKGDVVYADAIYKNTEGNYWYKISDDMYLFSEHCVFHDYSDPRLKNDSFPSSITGATSLEGQITTTGTLKSIQAIVYKGTTLSTVAITSDKVSVSGNSYNLKNSAVDNSLRFQDLAAMGEGYYTLTYQVEFTTNYVYFDYTEVRQANAVCPMVGAYTFYYGTPKECSHTYSSTVVSPTCLNGGYTAYTCKQCGYGYKDNQTSALGHSYGDWITVTEGSCTVDAVQIQKCTRCGNEVTQTVVAPGHSYESIVIPATCQTYEHTQYVCTVCEDTYSVYPSDIMSEWSTTKPTGVDEALIESRTEYSYQTKQTTTNTTGALNGWTLYNTTTEWSDYGAWSSWSDSSVTANDSTKVETRTVYGYYYYKCPSCGAHMHGYGTCYTWAGGCGAKTTSAGWNEVWSTVTWNEAGLKDWHGTGKYYTTINGELVFQWSSNGQPKTQYRYCTRSLETVYHFYQWSDWSEWGTNPIDASDTVNVQTRTVYRYAQAELADHSWNGGTVTIEPTCSQYGEMTYTCIKCGVTKTETMDTTLHTYSSVVVEPTCTAQGYTTHTCSCGYSYKGNYTNALGHTFVGGACKRCDEKDPDAPGAENSDVIFTLSDVSGMPGDTIRVEVSVESAVDFNSIALHSFTYDPKVLTFIGFENNEAIKDKAFLNTFDKETQTITIGLNSVEAYSGKICDMIFAINDNVATGTITDINALAVVKLNSTVISACVEGAKIEINAQLLGDIDCNETVDINDAQLLFRYSMLPTIYPIQYVGNIDFNKDGVIDINDAQRLFQYSMLPDIYPIA